MPFPLLLPLAVSVLPELARLFAGDRAGKAADLAAEAVRTVTGSDDPAAAEQKLRQDPEALSALRIRLAEISLEAARLQQQEEAARRQAELDELGKRLADVQSARGTMVDLVRGGSAIGWGAPVVSIIVTLGFFVCLGLMLGGLGRDSQLLNVVVGALVAAFTAVVNFWIGSSRGSQIKDETARIRSADAAEQFRTVLAAQAEQSRTALEGAQQVALSATSAAQLAPQLTALRVPLPGRAPEKLSRCLNIVLAKEGGFSNHPADPGGMTNFGVTRRTYADFLDIPEEQVTEEMMRSIPPDEVREIYRSGYWTPARCDELPPGLDLMVFDFAVNAGVRRAVRLLQEELHVKVDGSIGPMTLAAAGACNAIDLINRYAERRLAYYQGLDTFSTFGKGWTARVAAVREEALRMANDARVMA
ncbi:MAG TPA: glycosyl hydrolase 108 family protein [Roseomonas sp.]|nr:glycosyl hydrolase 108 family protein [Roseomonas sp.]